MKARQIPQAAAELWLAAAVTAVIPACDKQETPLPAQKSQAVVVPTSANSEQLDSKIGSSRDSPLGRPADWLVPAPEISQLPVLAQRQILLAREALSRAPGSTERVAELGMLYLVNNLTIEAESCFREAAGRIPNAMKFRYLLALTHEQRHEARKAIEAYEQAIERDPSYIPAYVNLAGLLIEKNPARSRELYEKAVSLDPKDANALFGLARIAHSEDRREEAVRFCSAALAIHPANAAANALLADLLTEQGKPDDALRYRAAASTGSLPLVDNDPIRFELQQRSRGEQAIAEDAMKLVADGNLDAAAKLLEQAVESRFAGECVLRTLGEVYLHQGLATEALAQFSAAQHVNPNSLETKSDMALALADLNRLDEAEALLGEVLTQRPADSLAMRRLAVILNRKGLSAQAAKTLEEASRAAPRDPGPRLDLGVLYASIGEKGGAMRWLNEAISLDPNAHEAHHRLAQLLLDDNQTDEAIQHWKHAIAVSPKYTEASLSLSNALLRAKQPMAALNFLQSALDKSPDSPQLANAVAWVLATTPDQSIRNPDAALTWARKACERAPENFEFLDTLAVALAATSQFSEAVQIADQSIARADAAHRIDLKAVYEARRDGYRQRRPYIENP